MSQLIEALTIFLKYADHKWPTHCEHDTLYIVDIDPSEVSAEDLAKLEELGFYPDEENPGFTSSRFGSA